MLTYAEALQALTALPAIQTTESVALEQAFGRCLAQPVALGSDQPPFDRATMDGFAVSLAGENQQFSVVGIVPAGTAYAGELKPGQAVRIMTGAPVPSGTTVIPLELTDQAGAVTPAKSLTHKTINPPTTVTITEPRALVARRNIAWRGEDGRAGAIVVPPGIRLGPATMALAAMAGARTVTVIRDPRLAIITTGDEVGSSGAAAINDSNGPFLVGFAAALGLSATRVHVSDDAVHLRAALVSSFDRADIVVTTGGVSAGDKDFVPVLAPSLGLTTVFHHLAIQPGKPVFLARRSDGRFLVGLPGNPVSVLATAHLVLLPLLRQLLGLPVASEWELRPLTQPGVNRSKRQLFLPGRLTATGVEPLAWNGSGDLIAAAAGDCLIDLAPESTAAAGTEVQTLPYVGTTRGSGGLLPAR